MSTGGGGEKVGSGGSASAKTPSDFLKSIRGRPVVVKLNSGVDYRGPCLGLGKRSSEVGSEFEPSSILYISTSKRTLADGGG
ncbi:hypothetical protein B296_00007989 [Ensete ventricosum]|uniref:LSM domain-containing protein n=1 Tax=Ensete ventricosum TaxID=4639 RepID=A0A427AIW5_ENSVE|nr:hypothetical protein B296_00007989 [Ensete ventricosum]